MDGEDGEVDPPSRGVDALLGANQPRTRASKTKHRQGGGGGRGGGNGSPFVRPFSLLMPRVFAPQFVTYDLQFRRCFQFTDRGFMDAQSGFEDACVRAYARAWKRLSFAS